MEIYISALILIVLIGVVAEVLEARAERRRRARSRELSEFPGLRDDEHEPRDRRD